MISDDQNRRETGEVVAARSRARRLMRMRMRRMTPQGGLGWARRVAVVIVVGLACLAVYQGLFATTPAVQHTVVVAAPPTLGIDLWKDGDAGATRVAVIAVVVIDNLEVGGTTIGPVQRILYDAPPTARVGDRLTASVSTDGRQVRSGRLPGPPVLPGGQGATLLVGVGLWLVLFAVGRRSSRLKRAC